MSTPQQTLTKTNVPCLYRSKQSGVFYALFKVNKRQVKRSLQTTNKAKARADLETLRQQVCKVKPGTDYAFAVVADRWLESATVGLKASSRSRRELSVKALKAGFPSGIASITRSDVEQWVARRLKQVEPETVNKELAALKGVLTYAVREGMTTVNVVADFAKLKTPKPVVRIPTKAEFAAVLGELARYKEAMQSLRLVQFLAFSGCRRGEALAMTWGDVDFERGTFKVTGGEGGTKNHRERVVPLFAPLRELVESMKPETPDLNAKLFNIVTARTAIAAACRRAKVEPFGHHALRHLFVSTCVEQGVDFRTVAEWVGHSDGGALLARTYSHLRAEHSRAMAERLTVSAYTVTDKATTSETPTSADPVASVGGTVTVTGFASSASFTFA